MFTAFANMDVDVSCFLFFFLSFYEINLRTAAVFLFETSSAQLRSNPDLEGPESLNYCQSSGRRISFVATLLNQQQSAHLNKVKDRYMRYINLGHHTVNIKGIACDLALFQYNLLDKLTRITPHDFARDTSSFIQTLGEEILHKQASPQIIM